ncbi:MAG: hypothetical protein AAGF85_09365 [Bacteroidota bacterium]
MEELKTYFSKLLLALLVFNPLLPTVKGQGNCLIYDENSGERIACELSYRAVTYKQGSKASQILFDAAIDIGPGYAWAYYEKSVPYFKRGLLKQGVELLNKAIAIDPESYLCYRAYWYFSHRSYEACISDLERYYYSLNGPPRSTPGGDMEMKMLLGLTYAQKGNLIKAIELVSTAIDSYEAQGYFVGPFDFHVLGILHYENNQLTKAFTAFEQQIKSNENFADTYYYMGLIQRAQSNDEAATKLLEKSLSLFNGVNGGFTFNSFLDWNVSKSDVEKKL